MVEPVPAVRIVATPAAIDAAVAAASGIAMRLAADELLLLDGDAPAVADDHAIVVADAGWAGVWLDATTAESFLDRSCDWDLPAMRPAFAQGMVAHLAVKLWLEVDRTLVLVPRPLAAELAERLEEPS